MMMIKSHDDLELLYDGADGIADKFMVDVDTVKMWRYRGLPRGTLLPILLDALESGSRVDPALFHLEGRDAERLNALVLLMD